VYPDAFPVYLKYVQPGGEMRARAFGPVQNPGSTAGKRVYPEYKKNSTAYTPANCRSFILIAYINM
jgi:hypothetical protein